MRCAPSEQGDYIFEGNARGAAAQLQNKHYLILIFADMAELADALDSGTNAWKALLRPLLFSTKNRIKSRGFTIFDLDFYLFKNLRKTLVSNGFLTNRFGSKIFERI